MARRPKRSKNQKEEEEFVALDELYLALSKQVDKVPVGEGKAAVIKWSIIAAILITISSVLFYLNSVGILPWVGTWIPAFVGSPAGVILYLIGLGAVRRTKVSEWSITHMRETYSFKQRLKRIAVWFGIYALVFIPLGRYIPYGLGGALLITLVMTSLTVVRRTPQELIWAKQGVPDPRDLLESEGHDDYVEDEESPVQESSSEADKIYYDEQRGGFGGKLK